jgi:hypothetical protein
VDGRILKQIFEETGLEVTDWISVAQDRDGNEPSNSRKF